MTELEDKKVPELEVLVERLEGRVSRIEDRLGIAEFSRSATTKVAEPAATPIRDQTAAAGPSSWESKIGEFWLAHLGTVVLLMGIAFLISYPFAAIPPVLLSALGYLAVGGIFGLSHFWRKSYQYLSRILFGGGLVLLYFATLRLHFVTDTPAEGDKIAGLAAVTAVLAVILYLSIRRESQLLCGLALFLSYASCLVSDTTYFALSLITLSTLGTVYLLTRFNWQNLAVASLVMAYLTHLLWLMNNPIVGNPIQVVSEHHYNHVFLFVYVTVFGLGNLFTKRALESDFSKLMFSLLHSGGFVFLGSVIGLALFKEQFAWLNLAMATLLIGTAILYWARFESKYATAIYASLGYMALSVAIFAQFASPNYFVWLGWQSLLVISTAIWFRSRILIVVNTLIYLSTFMAYLALAPSNDFVNLSYAIVALTSARVLNWRKERLELQTDLIRNLYLTSAFVVVLYGLHRAVPPNYVSLSWLGASLFYFALSLALKNIKYRWMGILTMFAMLVYVFFFDLATVGAELRILLFLTAGFVLLTVSLFYSRHRTKTS